MPFVALLEQCELAQTFIAGFNSKTRANCARLVPWGQLVFFLRAPSSPLMQIRGLTRPDLLNFGKIGQGKKTEAKHRAHFGQLRVCHLGTRSSAEIR